MNPLALIANPVFGKAIAAFAVLVVLVAGYLGWHEHVYDQGFAAEKAIWDADKDARKKAEEVAVAKRLAENAAAKEIQAENSRLITRKYDDEISALRDRIDHAPRLHVGPAICGGPASPAAPSGAGSGDAADPAGRLVPDDVDRDLRALMKEVEEALATARAAQQFIRDNGMAPP